MNDGKSSRHIPCAVRSCHPLIFIRLRFSLASTRSRNDENSCGTWNVPTTLVPTTLEMQASGVTGAPGGLEVKAADWAV